MWSIVVEGPGYGNIHSMHFRKGKGQAVTREFACRIYVNVLRDCFLSYWKLVLLSVDMTSADVDYLRDVVGPCRHQKIKSPKGVGAESVEGLSPGFGNQGGRG